MVTEKTFCRRNAGRVPLAISLHAYRKIIFSILFLHYCARTIYSTETSGASDSRQCTESGGSPADNTCAECGESSCDPSWRERGRHDGPNERCSLYLAKSTIPNAGLGLFTGVALEKDDHIGFSDPAVPLVDLDFHNGGSMYEWDYHWMITDYDWKPRGFGPKLGKEGETVSAIAPGMGSMPNCHFRLRNAAETHVLYDTPGVQRRGGLDPGIGAFTGYHNRSSYALEAVEAGSELFVNYGTQWFLTRESMLGLIPLRDSYKVATSFMTKFQRLFSGPPTDDPRDDNPLQTLSDNEVLERDLWNFVHSLPYKSRPLSALPKTISVAKHAMEVGIKRTELEQSIRSLEYLETHGKCLDNLRPGNSTIPQAGRGAFSTRFLPKGSMISPAPLLHIPDRYVLNMYQHRVDPMTKKYVRDLSTIIGKQLLLNYCFGHNSSTLLLCPYGPGTWFINHNSKSPNAKIVWSNDPLYHNSSWLQEPIDPFFESIETPGVAFEYIALRDIDEGEEVTIDYGKEWEDAWNDHVANWVQPKGSENYTSPAELNADEDSRLKTYDEDPTMYGEHIEVRCKFSSSSARSHAKKWREIDMEGTEDQKVQKILERKEDENYPDYHEYTLELLMKPFDKKTKKKKKWVPYVVEGVPREAVTFEDRMYHSDMFIVSAFRHEMMVPDGIFPDAWRNIN